MSLYQKASLVQIPSGYKASADKLYSVVPSNGDGDFTVDSDADATRVNKDGLIESVVADQARLNYDPTNPQDPHLLLEPTRTNNASRSETPQDGSWSDPLSEWTLLTETTTSPRGDQTRVFNLEDSTGTLIRCQDFSVAAETYTISFYIKDIGGNFTGGIVDLGDVGSGDTTPSLSTVGSEWVRVSRTITTTSTKTFLDIQLNFTGSTNKVGIWGLQLEAGSQPTSYIQTTGTAAVTRTRDLAKIETYSALPSDYPLTVFWEGKIDNYNAGQFIFSIFTSGSNAKYLGFAWNSTSNFYLYRRSSTNNDADLVSFSSNQNTTYKVAVSFISNTEAKIYINGSLAYNLTSGLDVDYEFNSVLIGSQRVISDSGLRNSAKQFMIFNEALTDAELQTLTS